MTYRLIVAACIALGGATPALAQHGAPASAGVPTAPKEATQFDFLVGQFSLTVQPAVSGLVAAIHGSPKLAGTWKGWRALDGWGVEDELRIVDESGNPRSYSHAVRFYDAAAQHWINTTIDVYRGVTGTSTATWKDGQLTVMLKGTDGDGKAYLGRTRFFEITPTAFKYQQDRSYDDGKTWKENLRFMAKRTAATAPR